MTHVMLDIETLGTGSHAPILSIGAVTFDPWGKGVESRFHQGVTFESALKYGRLDASTLEWWFDPKRDEARHQLMGLGEREDLDNVLFGLTEWFPPDVKGVWGNGSDFDNVIVSNAYTATGWDRPWSYHATRCFRTLKTLAPRIKPPKLPDIVEHSALDDAIVQALWLQKIVKRLGLEDL